MRVSRDDHAVSARGGIDGEVAEVVQDEHAVDLGGLGQHGGPRLGVDVAAHGGDGRDGAKRVENLGAADVAGMDDEVGPFERGERARTKQAVSIGDDADARQILY